MLYAVPANDIPTIRTVSDDMKYKITSYELRIDLLLLYYHCDSLSHSCPHVATWRECLYGKADVLGGSFSQGSTS
jgi:hypothetical protein